MHFFFFLKKLLKKISFTIFQCNFIYFLKGKIDQKLFCDFSEQFLYFLSEILPLKIFCHISMQFFHFVPQNCPEMIILPFFNAILSFLLEKISPKKYFAIFLCNFFILFGRSCFKKLFSFCLVQFLYFGQEKISMRFSCAISSLFLEKLPLKYFFWSSFNFIFSFTLENSSEKNYFPIFHRDFLIVNPNIAQKKVFNHFLIHFNHLLRKNCSEIQNYSP